MENHPIHPWQYPSNTNSLNQITNLLLCTRICCAFYFDAQNSISVRGIIPTFPVNKKKLRMCNSQLPWKKHYSAPKDSPEVVKNFFLPYSINNPSFWYELKMIHVIFKSIEKSRISSLPSHTQFSVGFLFCLQLSEIMCESFLGGWIFPTEIQIVPSILQ